MVGSCVQVYVLHERGNLEELIDPTLGSDVNKEEALGMINVALMCTNASPTLRPTMSAVASMLEGRTPVADVLSDPSFSIDDMRFKAMKAHLQASQGQSESQTHSVSMDGPWTGYSTSAPDLYPVNPDTECWNNRS